MMRIPFCSRAARLFARAAAPRPTVRRSRRAAPRGFPPALERGRVAASRAGHRVRLRRARDRARREAPAGFVLARLAAGEARNPDRRGGARPSPPGPRLAADGRGAARTSSPSAPRRCSSRSTRPTPPAIALYRRFGFIQVGTPPELLPVGRTAAVRRACHAPRSSLASDRCSGAGLRMIGWSGLRVAPACCRLATLVPGAVAAAAMQTGLVQPGTVIRGLWHRIIVWALGLRVHVTGALAASGRC